MSTLDVKLTGKRFKIYINRCHYQMYTNSAIPSLGLQFLQGRTSGPLAFQTQTRALPVTADNCRKKMHRHDGAAVSFRRLDVEVQNSSC